MKVFIFILLNFIVGFISDIALNVLSTRYGIVSSLKPYFAKQTVLSSAFNAGLTIVVALLITMVVFFFFFEIFMPTNYKTLFYFCCVAFIIGYASDYFIYAWKIFGDKLDLYYKKVGYGFWGASAFIFSIITSYFLQNKILYNL
jgi:hypothetical protein